MDGTRRHSTDNAGIQLGPWQAVFVFILCVVLLLPYISWALGLPGIQLDPLYTIPISVFSTISLWLFFNLLIYVWPGSGPVIGKIIGRYEFSDGWSLKRYAFANRNAVLDLDSSSPHILIFGGSQSGKSSTIKKLLSRFLEEKGRGNIILDYHGEYRFLCASGFTVVDARDYDPLAPNHERERYDDIVSDFVESFVVAFETVGEVQLAILKKKLMEHGSVDGALSAIESDLVRARTYTEKDRLNGLSLRLEKIVRNSKGRKALPSLSGGRHNIVFDLSGIRDRDSADFYAENILRRSLALLLEKKRPTNIIIDEAHRLNANSLQERGIEPTTVRVARESGKFNGRLLVASQNLTDFTPGFSANFGNIICFRIPAGTDLMALEQITGIRQGMLQMAINGFHKGEALLIGPHSHYSLIRVSLPSGFPRDALIPSTEAHEEPAEYADPVQPPQTEGASNAPVMAPRIPRAEGILEELGKHGASTATVLSEKTGYPKPAVWRHLQSLTKSGKVIRYEETETPTGLQVYYEINDPRRPETSFHKMLIAKAADSLSRAGEAKVIGGYDNPDIIFDRTVAVEVETGLKPELVKFAGQVRKRFEQGYSKVIVVVINQRQKARYVKALEGLEKVEVAKFTDLARLEGAPPDYQSS